jgi:hypothetical protein
LLLKIDGRVDLLEHNLRDVDAAEHTFFFCEDYAERPVVLRDDGVRRNVAASDVLGERPLDDSEELPALSISCRTRRFRFFSPHGSPSSVLWI